MKLNKEESLVLYGLIITEISVLKEDKELPEESKETILEILESLLNKIFPEN